MPHLLCLTSQDSGDCPRIMFNEMSRRIALLLSRLAKNPTYRQRVLDSISKEAMPCLHAVLQVSMDSEDVLKSLRFTTERISLAFNDAKDLSIDRRTPGTAAVAADGFTAQLCAVVMLVAQDGSGGFYGFSTNASEEELLKVAELYSSAMKIRPLFSDELFDQKEYPNLSKVADFGCIVPPLPEDQDLAQMLPA